MVIAGLDPAIDRKKAAGQKPAVFVCPDSFERYALRGITSSLASWRNEM
jgi:hypothetical protein